MRFRTGVSRSAPHKRKLGMARLCNPGAFHSSAVLNTLIGTAGGNCWADSAGLCGDEKRNMRLDAMGANWANLWRDAG